MGPLTHIVLGEVAVEHCDMAAAETHASAAAAETHASAAAALLERYPDAGILWRRAEHLRGPSSAPAWPCR